MMAVDSRLVSIGFILWTGYCLVHIWHKVFSGHGLPKSIPWPGNKRDFWSRGKSSLRSFLGTQALLKDGYEKYSKNDQAFILPNMVFGPEVIIPTNQMQWLLDQPEDLLSQFEPNRMIISGDITLLHPEIMANRINKPVIENELTKKQDSYADDQIEEIQYGLGLNWANDTKNWKSIPVFEAMNDLVPRMIARTFVGLPLCRNHKYLHSAHAFNEKVPLVAMVEQLSVPILRPLMVRLAHAYDRMQYLRIKWIVLPVVKERLPAFQSRQQVDRMTKMPKDFEPNDFVQWALKYAFADGSFDPKHTPGMIAKQLACMSFASSHSSALALTNTLFDIASHPDSISIQNLLREEIVQTTAQQKATNPDAKAFGRANLAKMVRLDSAIRETIRRCPFSIRGIAKMVMAPQGIDLPTGEHLPKGAIIGISGWAMHHDNAFYSDAEDYKPFRFSDKTNEAEIEKLYGEGKYPVGGTSMTATGDHYLGFSHGRWACPGRFFAQNNLKRVLAQIILNYDIEPIVERPKNIWFNNLIGPPIGGKLRVRRRTPADV